MDSVDDSPFPLWPVDEPGVEEINTIGIGKYDYYSGGVIVVEEITPVLLRGDLGRGYILSIVNSLKE